MPRGKLVELRPDEGDDESTLYVKGFLARGEKADHFDAWIASHERLQASHTWGAQAFGYHWPAAQLGGLPALLGLAKGAVDLVRVLRNVRKAASLGHVGAIAAEQAVTIAVLFVRQYWVANRNARALAEEQAENLRALAERGEKVRVVAHSLGCRQVIEAVARLEPALRPHEIHLCAAAVREDDVADALPDLAREATFLYYTGKDRVLDLGFSPLARGRALGHVGPRRSYARLEAVDVSEHFDFFVHGEYKHRFSRLVR